MNLIILRNTQMLASHDLLHIYQKAVTSRPANTYLSILLCATVPLAHHVLVISAFTDPLNIKTIPTSMLLYMLLLLPVTISPCVLFLITSILRTCFTATFWRKPSLNTPGHNRFYNRSQKMHGSFLQSNGRNDIKYLCSKSITH